MKKSIKSVDLLFILVITFLFSFNIHAQQTKERELSNADKFSQRSGVLYKKTFFEIGKVLGVELKLLVISDIVADKEVKALRFEYMYKGSYVDNKIGSIDVDELDGLIKSVKYIKDNIIGSTPDNYTEVAFKSRSGFEAGCYYSKSRGKNQWKTYLQLNKYDSKSTVHMYPEDFNELLSLLEKAKAMM